MSVESCSVCELSRSLQLEVIEPHVVTPDNYAMTRGELSAQVFTRTLPLVSTTWFKVISIDRQALAAEVRRKLGSFVQDWEAPGMEDYDTL
jgi:hypothetical protein